MSHQIVGLRGNIDSLGNKVRQSEEHLHDGVHVAAVAEIVNASETRPVDGLQLTA